MAKLKTVKIRGIQVDVHVDPQTGVFHGMVEDEKVTAPTLEILEKKLKDATKPERRNLNIEFWRLEGGGWREGGGGQPKLLHGTITGKHATNNNMLVRIEGEKGSRQESSYSFGRRRDESFLRPPTDEARKKLLDLATAHWKMGKELDALIQRHAFDPKPEVEAALKKMGITED